MLDSYMMNRITTGRGTYVQVPEGHPALIELEKVGVVALCVMVGSGTSGRPKVFLFQLDDWNTAIVRQRECPSL
jgi:hypothetical protein